MTLTIRKTTPADVAAAERALLDGKAALAALDIPQWRGEYPNRVDIEDDMAHGASYVAVDGNGEVVGTMALSFDGEGTYDAIDGAWLTSSDSSAPSYAVIHRCAVRAGSARQGVMTFLFTEAERIARERGAESMRIDTHERNTPLQGLAAKCGYRLCGVITLSHEGEIDPMRIAFEKLL